MCGRGDAMYRLRHQRQLDNRIARLFAGSENPASPSDPPRAWGAPPGDFMAHPGEDTPETSSPSAWPDRTGIPDVPERGHPWAGRGRGRRHIFARMARAREELLVERGSSSHTRLPLEPLSPPEMHDEDNDASDDDLLYLEPWLHVHPELVDQIGAAAARSRMVPPLPGVITWPWRPPRKVRWGFGGVLARFRVHWQQPALEDAREPPWEESSEVALAESAAARAPPRRHAARDAGARRPPSPMPSRPPPMPPGMELPSAARGPPSGAHAPGPGDQRSTARSSQSLSSAMGSAALSRTAAWEVHPSPQHAASGRVARAASRWTTTSAVLEAAAARNKAERAAELLRCRQSDILALVDEAADSAALRDDVSDVVKSAMAKTKPAAGVDMRLVENCIGELVLVAKQRAELREREAALLAEQREVAEEQSLARGSGFR